MSTTSNRRSESDDDGIKRGGKMALLDAKAEQALKESGCPVRCCDYWPECSHVLAWIDAQHDE